MPNDRSSKEEVDSYHAAMERLVAGNTRSYAPNATSRTDYPTLEVQGNPGYSAEKHEIFFESEGPEGGEYVLVLDLSEKRAFHAHGSYESQQARGVVKDIEFPGV